jgi:cell fate (sporulation/competence/biofilm development) regulator YlbF (YheA/YmcA/DUF963 family)
MTDIMKTSEKKSEELGKLIADSDIFKAFSTAHEKLKADQAAKDLLESHQAVFEKVRMLEMEGKPLETEDKHALREAQDQLHANEVLQEYAKTQADFQALMNGVTRGIHSQIVLDPIWDDAQETE